MLLFGQNMDPHSLTVYDTEVLRRGQPMRIADIQWHPERSPRIVLAADVTFLSLSYAKGMVERLELEIQKKREANESRIHGRTD